MEHAFDIPVKDKMVEVVLDDGDQRQVDIANVRMLPHNYSRVGKFTEKKLM